ncbi:MAG: S9 family peptidase [Acidobacteriota bacterium]|nr:S9 family peptidase [Acidobacteriota bacterium]
MFKRILIFTVLSLSFMTFGLAIEAQLPPLIDRELLFGNPEIAGAQLSPDGKFIAFRKPYKGTMNIWGKRADEPFEKARPLTNSTARPIPGSFWSQDGKYILFTQDIGGNENFNVYAVNPNDTLKAGEEVPTARNLTDAKKVRAFIYHVPESEPDAIYVGLNDRDPAWHDLYKVKISTGERTLIRQNNDRSGGAVFDNSDKMRLVTRSPQSGGTEIYRIDAEGKTTKIYSCNVFESCFPARFHKDNRRVYIQTNQGEPDLTRLDLLDVETGKEELVESDPMNRVDFGGAFFSDVSDEIIFTSYTDDRTRRYWKNKKFEDEFKFLQSKLPNKEIGFGSSTKDERLFLITAFSDTDPGEVYLYNRDTKDLKLQYKVREKINRADLAPMTTIRYKSSDGLEIPALLTLPKGVPAKNLPVIINPHGGPWARDVWGYNSWAQFFANRGYAVLQPNFRASTGYGEKFMNAGNNEWGQKMQDDITWGVKHLISEGIADPKRVGIVGGSYGGYATLAGVTFTPDLYAAAVAYVAPSNLITLLESFPAYWESGRTLWQTRAGNPTTAEGKAQLIRQSPLTHVAKIKTPLMVVHGANDPRVTKNESDQIVVALRERNYPVEYIVAPDEGHGFARPVNNMAMLAAAEKFFAKHLGGRSQESMSPEVKMRLMEITVDPKTVTLTKKAEMNAAPTVNLGGKWNMSADANGQIIPVVLDLKQDGATLSGSLSSAMGGGTLTEGKVSGKMVMGTFKVEIQGQAMELKMEGTIDGEKMTGTLSGSGLPLITFTAAKKK